ncbi:MAG TPA: 1,4-alpha-glucan branching protein GlgB, partial [Pedobacter sp.]
MKVLAHSLFSEFDVALFISGKHFRLYEKFGSHLIKVGGTEGTYFSVWAPNAQEVRVLGDFNYWNKTAHYLNKRTDDSGIWEGFIAGVRKGDVYKYAIKGYNGEELEKGDPYAKRWEHPPQTASMVWDDEYVWKDKAWLRKRPKLNALNQPMSVYELHLGSWQRDPSEPKRVLTYKEIAVSVVRY